MAHQAVLEPPAGGVEDGSALTKRYRGLGRVGTVLLVLGACFTLFASVSLWSWRTFANSEGFADVATDMLKEPAVADALADQIVGILERQEATADAIAAVRPVIRQIVAEVVATPAFQGIYHAGVRELHAAIVNGRRTSSLVSVDDAVQLVQDALALINPGLARAIPPGALQVAVDLSQSQPADLFMRGADLAGWLILPFFAGALLCFTAAVRVATDRRRALEAVGVTLVAVGTLVFAVLAVLLNVTADAGDNPRERTALRAVFWSTMHLLNLTAKVLIVLGASVALAAALAGRGPLRERLELLGDNTRRALARPNVKALGAAAALGLGVLALIWPIAMGALLVRIGGLTLVVLGAVWVFDLIGASSWVSAGPTGSRVTPRRLAVGGTTGLATFSIVLLVGGMSFVRAVRAPDVDRRSMEEAGCNGYIELCDRPVDEVAFAGTHNSMSASAVPGWVTTRHTGGLGAQLATGVRAFLLDLHYGAPLKDLVRTDFFSPAVRARSDAELSPQEKRVVARTLAFFGGEQPDEDNEVYLCHLYCELGATRAEDAFRGFHDWLRVNPNEVVILVLEDHVTVDHAAEVLERSGLADRAVTWPKNAPAPTLRQMIESKKNVLVMAEHGDGGAARPWYHAAYTTGIGKLEDTPYGFPSMQELRSPGSCALARGRAEAPLLLMNHWIDNGLPSSNIAAAANDDKVLETRAQRCADERGQMVNIVAVDFSSRGDLFRVVAHLNDIGVRDAMLATTIR